MASVSNVFDALLSTPGNFTTKKKRRKGKKTQSAASETPSEPSEIGPQLIPASHELEFEATAAATGEARQNLWRRWATAVGEEASDRPGQFIDENGKPMSLRNALLTSHALEALAESCVDAVVTEDECSTLYRLFNGVLTMVESEVVQQLIFAMAKVSSLRQGKGPEVTFASKRALRDVVVALKQVEQRESGSTRGGAWKKKKEPKVERTAKKSFKNDKRAELHEAMDVVKSVQSTVDEMAEHKIGLSATRAVTDLQVSLSFALRPIEEMTSTTKKGKKGKKQAATTSPLVESLKQEEAAYVAEEARLNDEISRMEMKLTALRSQLTSLHVTRQQIQQRKESILQSHSDGQTQSNGTAPPISQEDATDAIECLESVISYVESSTGQTEEQKREAAGSYVDALDTFFSLCISRQDEFVKTARFLSDSIYRRLQQEEKMKEISSAAVTKQFLKTQQNSKHELEQQLKDVVFDSGDLMIKVSRVETDLEHRMEFLKKHVHQSTLSSLEELIELVKGTHHKIKAIATEKRELPPPATPEGEGTGGGRKKVDTKEIIKQEEAKAREEMAAKMQQKPKRTPHSGRQPMEQSPVPMTSIQPVHPISHAKPPAVQLYMTQSMEAVQDGRYDQPQPAITPMYPSGEMAYGDPPSLAHTGYSQAPPMKQSPPQPYEPLPPQPTYTNVPGPTPTAASGSTRRMPWKKIGEQQDPDQPDLPTPGEARQQGKL